MRSKWLRLCALCVLGIAVGTAARTPTALAATWCGVDRLVADRKPDAVGGHQWHVVYAVPADGEDRFATVANAIVADVELIDAWWRGQDPVRAPRVDQYPFPGCPSRFGAVDLGYARLPGSSRVYASDNAAAWAAFDTDLWQLGLRDPYKKYLVYYDGPISTRVCGRGSTGFAGGGSGGFDALVYVRGADCGSLGNGGYLALTAAHELVHALDAVSSAAPHVCSTDPGHVCDDYRDLLFTRSSSLWLADYVLDVGRDDYYGHTGAWWDVRDSPFLSHLEQPPNSLTVAVVDATPSEFVRSELPGIACGQWCTSVWDWDATVRLSAFPERGRRVRWNGGCAGTATICEVRTDTAREVTATFEQAVHELVVTVVGKGRVDVSPHGGRCTRRCSWQMPEGITARARAHPATGWRFVRWRGCAVRCVIGMTSSRHITAIFRRR